MGGPNNVSDRSPPSTHVEAHGESPGSADGHAATERATPAEATTVEAPIPWSTADTIPPSQSPSSSVPWSQERLTDALVALEGLLVASEERQQRAFAERWLGDADSHLDVARARRVALCLVDAMVHRDAAAIDRVRRFWPRLSPQGLDATAASLSAIELEVPTEQVEISVIDANAPTSTAAGTVVLRPFTDAEPPHDPPPMRGPRGTWLSGSQRSPGGQSPAAPVMDLEQYAVLCAWTESHPERRASLHAKYGLADEAARQRLDDAYEAQFRVDAALRLAFAARVRLYLQWIRANG